MAPTVITNITYSTGNKEPRYEGKLTISPVHDASGAVVGASKVAGDVMVHLAGILAFWMAGLDPLVTTAVLVHGHGPFCWGTGAAAAAHTGFIIEEIARIAFYTSVLHPGADPISRELRDKHFSRKHGPGAYYGQK